MRDKSSGFFGGVVDNIKDFFGIKSPSTLFRDEIGKNMALGIGVGFGKEMDSISKEMQNAIPTSLDGPNFDINTSVGSNISQAITLTDLTKKVDSLASFAADSFMSLLEAMDMKIVLDDGTLVGRLTPAIDKNLGLLKRRSLAY